MTTVIVRSFIMSVACIICLKRILEMETMRKSKQNNTRQVHQYLGIDEVYDITDTYNH